MREEVSTEGAPQAIGPYSQAIRCEGLLFCSGQIALDPETGNLVGDTAAAEARRCLENLRALLDAGGSSLDDCLQVTIYLSDMKDFASVNEVYGGYFADPPPARAAVAVAALPKGARVEIQAIAALRR